MNQMEKNNKNNNKNNNNNNSSNSLVFGRWPQTKTTTRVIPRSLSDGCSQKVKNWLTTKIFIFFVWTRPGGVDNSVKSVGRRSASIRTKVGSSGGRPSVTWPKCPAIQSDEIYNKSNQLIFLDQKKLVLSRKKVFFLQSKPKASKNVFVNVYKREKN